MTACRRLIQEVYPMKFCSTRNRDLRVTSAQAILRGLSEDGGLYTPAELPAFLPE